MSTVGGGVTGRAEEVAAIASSLSAVEDGPAAIVLTGEAGIGKSILWEAGLELARRSSFRVLSARPAESEAKLSLAAVGDLFEPVLDDVLPLLPPPQRRALEAALLIVEPEARPPDGRAVAVAFLAALQALGRAAPVLVAVDDVQWLDAPSEGMLRFVARRLRESAVVVLVAERETDAARVPLGLDRALPEERVTSIRVGPLATGATRPARKSWSESAFGPPRPAHIAATTGARGSGGRRSLAAD